MDDDIEIERNIKKDGLRYIALNVFNKMIIISKYKI